MAGLDSQELRDVMFRVALYARYSYDRQRDVSIEEELRLAGQLGMLF
jgi:hypothetical protein